jgi:pyruvate formate lyase activating enzyme
MQTGKPTTAQELITKALRYKSYWRGEGGITVSGGEPLMQLDFLTELFMLAKKHGINTTIDTSGQPFSLDEEYLERFNKLMEYTDLLLLDIKHIDNEEHRKITGQPNENILVLAKYLSDINKPVWIRHVLVPGYSDNDEYLHKLAAFIKTLNNVQRVEVLPYHSLGITKYEKLGIDYPLKDILPPTEERVENAKKILGIE